MPQGSARPLSFRDLESVMARFKILVRKIVPGVSNCWCLCGTCMGGGHCYNKGTNCFM
jgi:hypothetical protein